MEELNLEGVITAEEMAEIKSLDFDILEDLENEEEKWLKERDEMFTCSEFHRLMTDEDTRELSKGAKTYVVEKVLKIVTDNERKEFYSKSINHGKETEVEAVQEFMKKTGLLVNFFGTNQKLIKFSKRVGGTPDGLIEKDEGLETKCPDSKTHYEWLRYLTVENFKKELKEYYWQVQGCMYITNRKKWYFVSYDPRFKNPEKRLLILDIHRNEEDITKLKRKLYLATKDLEAQLAEF